MHFMFFFYGPSCMPELNVVMMIIFTQVTVEIKKTITAKINECSVYLRHHFSILQRRERKSRTRLYFMPDRQIGPDWTVQGTGTEPVVSAHFAAAAAAAAAL